MTSEFIDAFCHIGPPEYIEAALRMSALPLHMLERARHISVIVDIDKRLELMDQFPGYQQIPSLVSPPIESICTSDRSLELAQIGNDALAEMVAKHRDRFPGFVASLPMNKAGDRLSCVVG